MRWDQPVRYASVSDIGFRRRNNQDACAIRICSDQATWRDHGHMLLVADGMGGHAVGELASKIAADTVGHTFFKIVSGDAAAALKESLETANATIYQRGALNRDFARMGTTCTALVLCPKGAIVGHVGDSRLYRVRGDRIDQLTFDHSLQWELIRQGKSRPEEIFLREPRHVITRSLGPEPNVEVDIEGPHPVLSGDVYVLCSDGLTGHLQDAEIGIIASELPPTEASRLMVNLCNLRGGSDNVTVVIARIGGQMDEDADHYDSDEPRSGGLAWGWLIAIWLLAILFVGGVTTILFGRFLEGLYLVAAAAFSAVGVFAYWLEKRPRAPATEADTQDTRIWRPYRSASARMSVAFLNHLASLEAELQRTATEERWQIDWIAHEAADKETRAAFDAQEYAKALAAQARTIDVLMAGLLHYRRQVQRQSKWGRPASPNAGKGES